MCHYVIQEMKRFPSEFMALPKKEKAFMVASVGIKAKQDKQERDKLERLSKKVKK